MSFDFSKVKSITIPEGNVKQIQDSNGNIIWKSGNSVKIILQANETGTIKIGSASAVNIVSGQAYDIPEGSGYYIVVNTGANYYFDSTLSGWSAVSSIWINGNQTKYKQMTLNVSASDVTSVTYTIPTAIQYYTYTINDGSTYTNGTITFSATAHTETIDEFDFSDYFNFTGSITVDLYFRSRKLESDYGEDDRIITGYSGEYTSTSSLGSLWLGPGTGYDYVRCNKTISSTTLTTITAVDSAAGEVTNKSYCTVTITNTNSNKSYTMADTFNSSVTLYCDNSHSSNNTITVNNKSSDYNYSGEGEFDFEDMGLNTVTVTRSLKTYTVTIYNRSSYTIYCQAEDASDFTIAAGSSSTLTYGYDYSSYVRFKKNGESTWSSTINYTSYSDTRTNHTLNAYISANSVYAWQWHDDSKTPTASYQGLTEYLADQLYTGWASYAGYNPFNRDSSSNRVKITINGTNYISEIPDGMPYSFDDSSDSWNVHTKSTITPSGYTVGGALWDVGDEDTEMYAFIGVKGNFSGSVSVHYGTYTYDYIRTDYSPYWG